MRKIKYIGNSFKHGQMIISALFFMIGVIVFIFSSFFAYQIWSEISPDIQTDLIGNNESLEVMTTVDSDLPSVLNGAIIFIFIGFWAFVLVAAFVSTDHPVMFILSIIMMIFVLILSMYMSNMYQDTMEESDLSTLPTIFPIPNWMMTHLLELNIGILLLGIIISIGKNKYES